MKLNIKALIVAMTLLSAACAAPAPSKPDMQASPATSAQPTAGEPPMQVTHPADRGGVIAGDPKLFTGQASIQMLFGVNGPRNFSGANVTFQPGARTAWHSHPAGQTLIITEGTAWVQLEGQPRQELEPGDVIWTPPGVRHWHGATPYRAMTHTALQSAVDGKVVDWQELVTDAQYEQTPAQ